MPIVVRHVVYSAAMDLLDLRVEALDDLIGRGLTPGAIELAGYRSLPRRGIKHRSFIAELVESLGEELLRQCPGFTDKNGRLGFWTAFFQRDGYVVFYRDEYGFITGFQAKILGGKYLTGRGSLLSTVYHLAGPRVQGQDLYVTEGATKASVASHLGDICTFAVAGQSLTPQHIDVIQRLRPGRVIVALDQEDNVNTDRARERWSRMLWEQGLEVFTAVWESEDLGGCKGLDDLLLCGEYPRIRRVCQVPSELGQAQRPRPTIDSGRLDPGQSLEEVRKLTRRSIKEFLGHPHRNEGQSLLVRTAPGSGKTTAVAQTLRESRLSGRILVGTRRLAAELAHAHGYTLIDGRNEDNCERIDVVEALADAGHDIGKLACGTPSKPRCPHREDCPYWEQFESMGTRVAASEQLFDPRYLEHGDVIVVDDADLSRSLVERHYLDSAALDQALDQLKSKRWREVRQIFLDPTPTFPGGCAPLREWTGRACVAGSSGVGPHGTHGLSLRPGLRGTDRHIARTPLFAPAPGEAQKWSHGRGRQVGPVEGGAAAPGGLGARTGLLSNGRRL